MIDLRKMRLYGVLYPEGTVVTAKRNLHTPTGKWPHTFEEDIITPDGTTYRVWSFYDVSYTYVTCTIPWKV